MNIGQQALNVYFLLITQKTRDCPLTWERVKWQKVFYLWILLLISIKAPK